MSVSYTKCSSIVCNAVFSAKSDVAWALVHLKHY